MTDPATLAERLQAVDCDVDPYCPAATLCTEAAATLTAQAERIAFLEHALRHAHYRTHTHSLGCDGCRSIDRALGGAE